MLCIYRPEAILPGDLALQTGGSFDSFLMLCLSSDPILFYPRLLLTDGGLDFYLTGLDRWSVCLGDSKTGLSLWLSYFSMLVWDFAYAIEPFLEIWSLFSRTEIIRSYSGDFETSVCLLFYLWASSIIAYFEFSSRVWFGVFELSIL